MQSTLRFESMGVVLEGHLASVPQKLKNQSLYHEILLLQKFYHKRGKVLKKNLHQDVKVEFHDKVTGFWAFEDHLHFQNYQQSLIMYYVVRYFRINHKTKQAIQLRVCPMQNTYLVICSCKWILIVMGKFHSKVMSGQWTIHHHSWKDGWWNESWKETVKVTEDFGADIWADFSRALTVLFELVVAQCAYCDSVNFPSFSIW